VVLFLVSFTEIDTQVCGAAAPVSHCFDGSPNARVLLLVPCCENAEEHKIMVARRK
jgi:hypothetical protein